MKKLKYAFLALGLTIIILYVFQSTIFNWAYGMNEPKILTTDEKIVIGKSYNIDSEEMYLIDSNYVSWIDSFRKDTSLYYQAKNHSQPAQVLYFDKTGNLVCFYINCYAGGFPNLDWNKENSFDTFLPKQQAPLDSLINFQSLRQYIIPIAKQAEDTACYDYNVVVFWNNFLGRQSKRLVAYVQQNVAKAKGVSVKVYYVNNDDLFRE